MERPMHHETIMIALALILALFVVGLTSRLRSGGDFADRDRRTWWPGAGR
jgi:hypothetical protein